jgi:DNA-binding IclR family transcriptional regulator
MMKALPPPLAKRRGRPKGVLGRQNTSLLSSVERTLQLIEIFSDNYFMGVTELAQLLKTGKSTVHRMLATLQEKGFLSQDLETGKYCLNNKIILLANKTLKQNFLDKNILQVLKDLAFSSEQNASFVVLTAKKDEIIVLAEILAQSPIIAHPMLFEKLPLYTTPFGILHLASLKTKQLHETINELSVKYPDKFAIKNRSKLETTISACKKNGYAVTEDELDTGLSFIAVNILNTEKQFISGFMLSGTSPRYTAKNIRKWGKSLLEKSLNKT